jgi:CheY-like chemotaxis protein
VRDRVLVVEDDRGVGTWLSAYLTRHGFDVVWVRSIAEAEAAGQQPFDAMLLDLTLPNGEGLDVVRAMRHLSDGQFLVYTGNEQLETEAFRLGVDDFLVKGRDGDIAGRVRKSLLRRQAMMSEKPRADQPPPRRGRLSIHAKVTRQLEAVVGDNAPAGLADAKISKAKRWWIPAGALLVIALAFTAGAFYVALTKEMTLVLAAALGGMVGLPLLGAMFCASQADGEATRAFLSTVLPWLPFLRQPPAKPAP